jgi:proline iminopeptidase
MFAALSLTGLLMACQAKEQQQSAATPPASYYDHAGEAAPLTGGARMVEIKTPKGAFHVWTKAVGNNPTLKVLLLHGGPAVPHDYLEPFDSFLPQQGIEYIYYDQLGAGNSDQPKDDDLWTLDRFVDEIEQVRQALKLDRSNFCLYGQSAGGLFAIEYALKYQQNLKCLIISNMMASISAYNDYAHKVLMPQMDPTHLALVQQLEKEGKTGDPRYLGTLIPDFYEKHILRMPFDKWPEPVNRSFARQNEHIYTLMQGPSEMGASGRLANWERFADLKKIAVPTLVIAAKYDTMDPAYLKKMAEQMPKGDYALMQNGSHLAIYDDQQAYFAALIGFLKKQE